MICFCSGVKNHASAGLVGSPNQTATAMTMLKMPSMMYTQLATISAFHKYLVGTKSLTASQLIRLLHPFGGVHMQEDHRMPLPKQCS